MDYHLGRIPSPSEHDSTTSRNLSNNPATTNRTPSPDKRSSSRKSDPQIIVKDLYSPSVEHRSLQIDETDWECDDSSSSVIYLGHNVFERHNSFDFLHYSTENQPHQMGTRRPQGRPHARSDATVPPRNIDPATQQTIDSDIVRWATAIPHNLPLNLSALAVMLRGSADKVPPVSEYPVMAFLAIYESPGRRLTDEAVIDALQKSFSWFSTHSDADFWKHSVINSMLFDTRFNASKENERTWTIDIAELHRRPFVNRDARDKPNRLLAPGPRALVQDYSSSSQLSADDVEMGRAHSPTRSTGGATDTNLRRGMQQRYAMAAAPRTPYSGTSHVHPSYDPAQHHTSSLSRSSSPPRSASFPPIRRVSFSPLPPYSEVLPAGNPSRDASPMHEDHNHADPISSDSLMLPSIRSVLGTEMHMVEVRRHTTGF